MDKCIFCEIAAKRTPALTVYEDAEFVAFLDINPLNRGHALIVPKHHARWTFEVEKFGDYFEVAKSVALAAMETLGASTVNFLTIGFGEMSVEHAHIHVVPRFENDGHPSIPDRKAVKEIPKEVMESIASKLKDAIAKNPPKNAAAETPAHKDEKPAEHEPEEEMEEEQIELVRRELECG
ncbi:MAG: HIT family protein [Candidatus Aenigmatarchaeota archaeon]